MREREKKYLEVMQSFSWGPPEESRMPWSSIVVFSNRTLVLESVQHRSGVTGDRRASVGTSERMPSPH